MHTRLQFFIVRFMKGFKYKMRYVYAHFPITGIINSGGSELEIRNFLGEKRRRKVLLSGDTKVVKSADVKDQIEISGIDIEDVGRSCKFNPILFSSLLQEKQSWVLFSNLIFKGSLKFFL